MGDIMFRDAKRRIVPQILTENGYSVLSNGDMTGIDIGRYKLLVDKRGDVLPHQYFDANQMKFVSGFPPGLGGGGNINIQEILEMITSYDTLSVTNGDFKVNLNNFGIKNVKIEVNDSGPKTVSIENVPKDAEIFMEVNFKVLSSITWFPNITWLNGTAPTFLNGKVYRLAFFTSNGGLNWHGSYKGGW